MARLQTDQKVSLGFEKYYMPHRRGDIACLILLSGLLMGHRNYFQRIQEKMRSIKVE